MSGEVREFIGWGDDIIRVGVCVGKGVMRMRDGIG